jgi:predicted dithiol-disulfide oxidoreductase (DUF899 family)
MKELKLPVVATLDEWHAEIDKLRVKEKELTRAHDTVNALRRRLPMVKIDKHYEFDSVEGNVTLIDLFCDRRQLIVYHFMYFIGIDIPRPSTKVARVSRTDGMGLPVAFIIQE